MATREDMVLKRFAEAKKNLAGQQKQAEDTLTQSLNRQQAVTGATGGRVLKAEGKARRGLQEELNRANTELEGQQSQTLEQIASEKEAKEFQAGEAEKQRLFSAEQADTDRAINREQFGQTFGLQNRQFQESQDQFRQQMNFQWTEFRENQKSNFINALTALRQAGIGNLWEYNRASEVARAAGA